MENELQIKGSLCGITRYSYITNQIRFMEGNIENQDTANLQHVLIGFIDKLKNKS